MEKAALIVGGLLAVVGTIGIIVGLVPPNDGALAVAGAIIFASGLISKAIGAGKSNDTTSRQD